MGVTHSCLLSKEGRAYCGGIGTNGELGIELEPSIEGFSLIKTHENNGSENCFEKVCPFVEISFFGPNQKAKQVSCGESMTAIIDENKNLYTFGKKSFERLGH